MQCWDTNTPGLGQICILVVTLLSTLPLLEGLHWEARNQYITCTVGCRNHRKLPHNVPASWSVHKLSCALSNFVVKSMPAGHLFVVFEINMSNSRQMLVKYNRQFFHPASKSFKMCLTTFCDRRKQAAGQLLRFRKGEKLGNCSASENVATYAEIPKHAECHTDSSWLTAQAETNCW